MSLISTLRGLEKIDKRLYYYIKNTLMCKEPIIPAFKENGNFFSFKISLILSGLRLISFKLILPN